MIRAMALLVGFMGCCGPVFALAHELQNDEPMRALLHISPDDDPIIGQPATLLLEFKDTTKKFAVADCNCIATIRQSGQELYSEPLSAQSVPGSRVHAAFAFTFPKKDIYQLEVSGTPRAEHSFEPFTLSYDLRVAREASDRARLGVHLLHFIGAGIIVVFTAGLIMYNYFNKRRAKN